MENTAQNTETKQNIIIVGSDNATGTIAALLYDKTAQQCFTLEISGDGNRYENTQIYKGLPDDVLEEFDRLREVMLDTNGAETGINTNSKDADDYLFENTCIDVLGFEGEKPEDWQKYIESDERRFGISKLLGFKILSSDKELPLKKRVWGEKTNSNTIVLKARFGENNTVICKAHFDKKTPADETAYNVIKSRLSLIDRDLDESVIKIPASMKRKADLFDKLKPKTEGYVGDPPLHHKAAFVTAFFEPKIASAEKK
jgi:hypothetical protein